MDPHFKENIILLAEVIVPQIYKKESLQYSFIKYFKQIFSGLEENSSKKIGLLVRVINILSYFYYLTSFNRLSYKKRKKFVKALFNFPVGTIVAGITGLRSLILISYYGIDQIWEEIDYEGPLNKKAS